MKKVTPFCYCLFIAFIYEIFTVQQSFEYPADTYDQNRKLFHSKFFYTNLQYRQKNVILQVKKITVKKGNFSA